MPRRFAAAFPVVMAASLAGACCPCRGARSAADEATGEVMKGKAVYYSSAYQGKKTASGEPYDEDKLTAAHRTLPFGTRVKVTNLASGKSVVVEVNDRGPFGDKARIIDLSLEAAKAIGMVEAGVVDVTVEILK